MVESNVCTATHSALTTSAIIGECACRSLLPALLYELEISDLRIVQFTRFLYVPQVPQVRTGWKCVFGSVDML